MNTIFEVIWQAVSSASPVEQAATVLGLLGVWLATRQNLWNFPVGLVQVVLAGVVFANQRLYADMSLQGVYFVALAWGWWCWTHPGYARPVLPVTHLTFRNRFLLLGAGLLITLLLSLLLARIGDSMPMRDAFLATFGVISQILEAHKKLEAWLGWVVVNITGLVICVELGLYWFVVLYMLYLVLSFVGFVSWRRSELQTEAA